MKINKFHYKTIILIFILHYTNYALASETYIKSLSSFVGSINKMSGLQRGSAKYLESLSPVKDSLITTLSNLSSSIKAAKPASWGARLTSYLGLNVERQNEKTLADYLQTISRSLIMLNIKQRVQKKFNFEKFKPSGDIKDIYDQYKKAISDAIGMGDTEAVFKLIGQSLEFAQTASPNAAGIGELAYTIKSQLPLKLGYTSKPDLPTIKENLITNIIQTELSAVDKYKSIVLDFFNQVQKDPKNLERLHSIEVNRIMDLKKEILESVKVLLRNMPSKKSALDTINYLKEVNLIDQSDYQNLTQEVNSYALDTSAYSDATIKWLNSDAPTLIITQKLDTLKNVLDMIQQDKFKLNHEESALEQITTLNKLKENILKGTDFSGISSDIKGSSFLASELNILDKENIILRKIQSRLTIEDKINSAEVTQNTLQKEIDALDEDINYARKNNNIQEAQGMQAKLKLLKDQLSSTTRELNSLIDKWNKLKDVSILDIQPKTQPKTIPQQEGLTQELEAISAEQKAGETVTIQQPPEIGSESGKPSIVSTEGYDINKPEEVNVEQAAPTSLPYE